VMYSSAPLGRRFGQRSIYVTGALVYAAVFATWAFVRDPLVITLVASADGVAFALAYTGIVVIVARLVPKRLASTGQALSWVVGGNIAPIAGGALGGVVYARLGAPVLFAGSAALCVVGAAVVWIVLGGTEHSQGA
jgi:MFS family permease